MADADPVDPKPEIEEACGHHCVKAKAELEACTERVNKILADAKPGDDAVAHCTGQYFDFWHCIDHCTAPKLFEKLV